MKKKNDPSDVVTRKILSEEFALFREDVDFEFEAVNRQAKQQHDQVMTKLDDIMEKFEALTQDAEIGAHQTRELREEVDGHEKRLRHLEKPHTAA